MTRKNTVSVVPCPVSASRAKCPSAYHIHENPVPEDGNCNSTGKHFDKYGVGDDFVCDKTKPEKCQLGDLSGKHGLINFTEPTTSLSDHAYHDDYLSTTPGDTAFFGDLSIVVHRKADKFRLACGNFRLFYDAGTSATVGPVPVQTRILPNSTMTGAPYPNATTSTLAGPNQTSAAGTVTDVVPAQTGSSATHAAASTSAKPSPGGVQTGDAGRGYRIQLWSLALELTAVAGFASYLG